MVMSTGGAPVIGAASASAFARELSQARAVDWYPDLEGRLVVSTAVLATRPRCTLVDVRLAAGGARHRVVVKIRSDRQVGGGHRPSLVPDRVAAAEQAAAEYAGLRHVESTTDPLEPRHGIVRALDLVPDAATVVLEHVGDQTLRAALLRTARFRPAAMTGRPGRGDVSAWRNAGSWLAHWHQWPGPDGALPRLAGRDELVGRFGSYGGYLAGRPGGAAAAEVARAGAALAEAELPPRPALAASHGDFAPRNVFVEPAGRVAVFDPMPRWQAPPMEDVCRFLVGVRLVGLQVHTQGHALAQAWLDRIEDAFLEGYGRASVPPGQLAAFRILVLLDKWAAAASGGAAARRAPSRSGRGPPGPDDTSPGRRAGSSPVQAHDASRVDSRGAGVAVGDGQPAPARLHAAARRPADVDAVHGRHPGGRRTSAHEGGVRWVRVGARHHVRVRFLLSLGQGKTLSRFLAIYVEERDFGKLFGSVLVAAGTVLATGTLLIGGLFLFRDGLAGSVLHDSSAVTVLLIVVFLAPMEALDQLFVAIFAVFTKPRSIFFRKYLFTPCLRLAVVAAVAATSGSVETLAVGYVGAQVLGLLVYMTMLRKVLAEQGLLAQVGWRDLRWPVGACSPSPCRC